MKRLEIVAAGAMVLLGGCLADDGSGGQGVEAPDPQTCEEGLRALGEVCDGTLETPRVAHTVSLGAGEVVIAGGGLLAARPDAMWWNAEGLVDITAAIEVLDEATLTVQRRAPMLEARAWHAASVLDNGQVIFSGGFGANRFPLRTVELYSPPDVAQFNSAALPPLATPRAGHTSSLIDAETKTLLFVGGDTAGTWELWDPQNGSHGLHALPDASPRMHHTATVFFLSGRDEPAVLIAGGEADGRVYDSVFLYDSVADVVTPLVSMSMPGGGRTQHAAAFLSGAGNVLVSGGFTDVDRRGVSGALDVFDADRQTFGAADAAQLGAPRGGHAMTLDADANIVITGGMSNDGTASTLAPVASVDVVEDVAGTTEVSSSVNSDVPAMAGARVGHRSVLLGDGTIALIGGATLTADGQLELVEDITLYVPPAQQPSP